MASPLPTFWHLAHGARVLPSGWVSWLEMDAAREARSYHRTHKYVLQAALRELADRHGAVWRDSWGLYTFSHSGSWMFTRYRRAVADRPWGTVVPR